MPALKNLININPESTAQKLSEKMQRFVLSTLQKRGAVIGISGGIDSSVCLALCIKSFGAKRVVGISIPETESNPESTELAQEFFQTPISSRSGIPKNVQKLRVLTL